MSANLPLRKVVSEALIKSVKKGIVATVGESSLTSSELHTIVFEIANIDKRTMYGKTSNITR